MIRTQVSLEREMYEAARREAARRGVSFASLVRSALADVLPSGAEKPWMELAGVVVATGDDSATGDRA